MKELVVMLDDETWALLCAYAKRNVISLEDAARRCIRDWLVHVESPNADPAADPTVRKLLNDLRPVVEAMERDD